MTDSRRERNEGPKRSQNLILENREKVSITGVVHVESFDEEHVTLETDLGFLEVRGEELHITKLDIDNNAGELCIEGYIYACEYFDDDVSKKGSFFSKLFK
jgi:sporulation protein YabP